MSKRWVKRQQSIVKLPESCWYNFQICVTALNELFLGQELPQLLFSSIDNPNYFNKTVALLSHLLKIRCWGRGTFRYGTDSG